MKKVATDDRMVTLLYVLMRDFVVPGDVAGIVKTLEKNTGFVLSNGFLADYAKDLVERLQSPEKLKVTLPEWKRVCKDHPNETRTTSKGHTIFGEVLDLDTGVWLPVEITRPTRWQAKLPKARR